MKKLAVGLLLALSLLVVLPLNVYAEDEPLKIHELCGMIVDAFGLEYDASMTSPYSDVTPETPDYEAICICAHYGLLDIWSGSRLYPEHAMSRGIAAEVLYYTGLPDVFPAVLPS